MSVYWLKWSKKLKTAIFPQIFVVSVISVISCSWQWEVQKGRLLIDNPVSRGRMSFSFLVNKSFPSSVPLQTCGTLIDLCSLNESKVWKMRTALKAATLSLKISILRHCQTGQKHPATSFLLVEKSVIAAIFHHKIWSLKSGLESHRGSKDHVNRSSCWLRVTWKSDQKIRRPSINISPRAIFTVKYGLLWPKGFSS